MAKFTDLTPISGPNMTNSYVFAVSTSSDTRSLSLDELEQSFTGLKAKSTDGISMLGRTVPSGITVGDNGFVGIDNDDPTFSLHVGDYNGVTNPEIRITGASSSRSVAVTMSDSDIYWKNIKKASDSDYYIQVSDDDTNYTGVFNITTGGNVGIFDGSSDVTNKLYVNGGDIKFQSGISGIIFDPGKAEIKTSVASDIFYINQSNTDDICLGNDIFYVSNNVSSPAVGIGTTSPSSPIEVHGEDTIINVANATSSRSRIRISNNVAVSFLTMQLNKLSIGPISSLSTNNIVYDLSNRRLGLGSTAPDNKLHIYSNTDNRLLKIEGKASSVSEVFQTNNFNNDEVSYTGPRHSVYTFARSVGTGPTFTNNVSKWGIGLYDDGVADSYEDVFVFRVDSDTSSASSIKAFINRDGDLDIKGSLTTDSDYTKGKFIQNYHTRCVSSDIYINPFEESSSTSANASSSTDNAFGIAPYAGTIKKIKIVTADTSLTHFTAGARFEISVVNASSGGTDEELDCFSDVAATAPTSLPTNGVVAQFNLSSVSSAGDVFTFTSFSGDPSFAEGQLVQFRICQAGGSATDINCTIMSSISYTVD
jgi:hypothetical protein